MHNPSIEGGSNFLQGFWRMHLMRSVFHYKNYLDYLESQFIYDNTSTLTTLLEVILKVLLQKYFLIRRVGYFVSFA